MKKTANTFDAENIKYLEGLIGEDKVQMFIRVNNKEDGEQVSEDEQKAYDVVSKCLDTMQKCGENRWWKSDDKRVIGYYQLMDPILLVPFDKFHESIEFLLGRPVWTHELGLNWEGLKAEAERAFNGNQDTEEQRTQSIVKSFEQLADFGKPVIGVVVD